MRIPCFKLMKQKLNRGLKRDWDNGMLKLFTCKILKINIPKLINLIFVPYLKFQ